MNNSTKHPARLRTVSYEPLLGGGSRPAGEESLRFMETLEEVVRHQMDSVTATDHNPAFRFFNHRAKWKEETRGLSDLDLICSHPSYLRIVGMGAEALPFIFRDLAQSEDPDHWFSALQMITDTDPIQDDDRGNMARMKETWLSLLSTKLPFNRQPWPFLAFSPYGISAHTR